MPGSDSDSWTIGAPDPTGVVGDDGAAAGGSKTADDAEAQPAPNRSKPSSPATGGGQKFVFALSAIALGLSVATLVIVLITRLNDDDNPPPAGNAAATTSATPNGAGGGPTQPPVASATQGGSNQQPTPTAPASTTAEIPVPCGDILVPLDKQHVLPRNCEPTDLEPLPPSASTNGTQLMRTEARAAILDLLAAAQNGKLTMVASSSYRSYDQQVSTFNSNVTSGGQAYAERSSARPGHSEHQLGTTTDLTSASAGYQLEPFEGTPEAKWLADNCWKFGFVISYPKGKEPITGYLYEPWHVRYVGKDIALKVKNSGITLHEYLLR